MSGSSKSRRTADETFSSLCRRLSDNSHDAPQISANFADLKSDSARVDFAYAFLRKFNLLPEVRTCFKNERLANELREEGNRLFRGKEDHRALIKYTESVAFAEEAGESLALAFANRSAVLFARKYYEECLEDISRAFSHNYPAHLKEKLSKRKTKAESLLGEKRTFSYHEPLPPLKHARNELIESAGACLAMRFEPKLGRHVVATSDIEVGDVIAAETPFASILLRENYLSHCYNCLRPCHNMIPCDRCPRVLFCRANCRAASWNSSHKYECPILSALLDLDVNKLTLVAARICILTNDPETPNQDIDMLKGSSTYKSQNYREIHNLISNAELRTGADLFRRAVEAAAVFHLFVEGTTLFGGERAEELFKGRLLLHMQTGPSNFHEISELVGGEDDFFGLEEMGAGAYAFLSLLNHSCAPNVVRHCYGDVIVLRALRPIRNGEQLFDNYGYHHAMMDKEERRGRLKKQYFFECVCEACADDWPLYRNLPAKHFDAEIGEEEITNLRNGNAEVAKTILAKLEKAANKLERSRPSKELADVQEILKQCYAIFGNKRMSF